MLKDILNGAEMLEKGGFKNIYTTTKQAPGLDIHEMGGARMGKDPKTSILNEHNQVECKECFVTDGAWRLPAPVKTRPYLYGLTARAVTLPYRN
jgi:choline dehydrogenase-like flavoprotein